MKARHATDGMVMIWCPGCDEAHGCDSRWTWNGSTEAPTLAPSLHVNDGAGRVCHSFVRDGMIQFLADSTHKLAGQTVELPEWESV